MINLLVWVIFPRIEYLIASRNGENETAAKSGGERGKATSHTGMVKEKVCKAG
jgi:hypothetical protein